MSQLQAKIRQELSLKEARELAAFKRIHISRQPQISIWRIVLIYGLLSKWVRRHTGKSQQPRFRAIESDKPNPEQTTLDLIIKHSSNGVVTDFFEILYPLKQPSPSNSQDLRIYLACTISQKSPVGLVAIKTMTALYDMRVAVQEILCMRGVNHPNLTSFKESFYDAPKRELSIVSEYMSGVCLSDVTSRAAPRSVPENVIAAVTVEVCYC